MTNKYLTLDEYIKQRKQEREYEYSPQWYKDKAMECRRIAKLNRKFYRKHNNI